MKVYIVEGASGQYEDYRTWIAKIFADSVKAQLYVNELELLKSKYTGDELETEIIKIDPYANLCNGVEYYIYTEEVIL